MASKIAKNAIDTAWPAAIGSSDRNTTARLLRCKPSATANNHPMDGLRPWKAPSPATTGQNHQSMSSILAPGQQPLQALPQCQENIMGSSKNPTSNRRLGAEPG